MKITVFDPRKSSSHPLLVRDVLIYVFQKSTSNNPSLHVQCIWQIFLFQEYCYLRVALTTTDFEWTVSSSGGHFQFLFRILCFFETSTCSHPFFQRNWLIWHTTCSHPFLESPLFYYKIAVEPCILSNLPCFFTMKVPARRCHSLQLNYQLWYPLGCRYVFIQRLFCYLMTSFTATHFFYVTVIIPRERRQWRRPDVFIDNFEHVSSRFYCWPWACICLMNITQHNHKRFPIREQLWF